MFSQRAPTFYSYRTILCTFVHNNQYISLIVFKPVQTARGRHTLIPLVVFMPGAFMFIYADSYCERRGQSVTGSVVFQFLG